MQQADFSEFIGAQFFFENMTKTAMREYGVTGILESAILVLTDTTTEDGSKAVISSSEFDNPHNSDGLDFLKVMILHTAKRLSFIDEVRKHGHNVVCVFERHLNKDYKSTGSDAILTIHTFGEVTIARTFVVVKNEMKLVNGEINYEMAFNEDADV